MIARGDRGWLLVALLGLCPAPAWADGGIWLPTAGEGGRRAAALLARSVDGAVWAAGGGRLHRIEPGGRWKRRGLYAPRLSWVGGEEVVASGPFDDAFLLDVAQDVAEGIDDVLGGAAESEDVRDLLDAYVNETNGSPESPYRVAGLVPGRAGVWLGGGVGLIHFGPVDRRVVPIPRPVLGLVSHPTGGVVAATAQGLYRVTEGGEVFRLLPGRIDAVAWEGAWLVILRDGRTWRLDPRQAPAGARPIPLPTPTGTPSRLASAAGVTWIATALAIYRRQDGAWRLCGPVPEPAVRLAAHERGLVVVTDAALYVTGASCEIFDRLQPPWPGGLRFLDATWAGDTLWAGTTEGVFVRGRRADAASRTALRLAGFRKALDRVPPLGRVLRDAFDYDQMSRQALSYGTRPLLARLLPTLTFRLETNPYRADRNQERSLAAGPFSVIIQDGGTLDQRKPQLEWRVDAQWTLRFEGLSALFEADPTVATEGTEAGTSALIAEVDDDYDAAEIYTLDLDDPGLVIGDVIAEVRANTIATERRLAEKYRQEVRKKVTRLYRQRQNLLYRIWVARERDLGRRVDGELRIREIDAQLNAYTGGAFARRIR